MNRTISRRIAGALAMPVLAAGLIGGGAVALSGEAPQTAYTSPAVMAVATAQPAVATAVPPAGHRRPGPAPAATTPIEPARFDTDPFTPAVTYPTAL